ncbi:SRPBCC family protein [Halodesulfurarchaeum formicicum]|uniref:Cyclase/dehydrase n=1 Tax=Halodesulfurarchaeum formicicum TaxID=1873524 RepID=A0A1J1AAX5_9EURY|nr:SRPBCC family protein [Halodesulfurarchaeum formicicum]APE95292.1 cyclase/dehydrase [Halodesulfurarchaeum formicicum]
MAIFTRRSTVDAPLETVWAFHSTIDGLLELTPAVANLQVEAIRVPDGGDVLREGSEIDLSVGPIPGGPRQRFTSVIVAREELADEAYFVDEMETGPMATWRHTHRFRRVGDRTQLIDHVEYESGYGDLVDRALQPGFALAFAYRHRKTREKLDGDET